MKLTSPKRSVTGVGRLAGLDLGLLHVHVWTGTYAAVTLSAYLWHFGFTLDIGDPA